MRMPATPRAATLLLLLLLVTGAAAAATSGCVPAMPAGAWDSHAHVTDPGRFPPAAGAAYTPGVHTVWDNAVFEHALGCERVVLVQPSIYGADNAMLLDALRALGPARARAVVVLDDDGGGSGGGVRVVLDHLAGTRGPPAADDAHVDALERLLASNSTWVKVSAPYRLLAAGRHHHPDDEFRALDPLIRRLLRAAPSRLVYGSDWPHTRFEGLDIAPWTRHLLNMTRGDDALRRRLFVDNARRLWAP